MKPQNKAYLFVHPNAVQDVELAHDMAIAADAAETSKARLTAAKELLDGTRPVVRGNNAQRNAEVVALADEALDLAHKRVTTIGDTAISKRLRLAGYEKRQVSEAKIQNQEAVHSLGLAAIEAEKRSRIAMADIQRNHLVGYSDHRAA